ncbi:hypothetical protein B0A48_08922 [Cryoendolithus antarcticus]|uniref:DNA-directed RNA polymerase subunit n=1 Tax=Cryoendolithus antarcticus TaxID=1507870 RepID=A0A1V8T4J0_9PEZI|nr:hypothetical protein B0A48_08922 [Cryoendolithus antarcticus]
MYVLTTISDTAALPPSSFPLPTARALENWLNAKYSDRILPQVGLCVCFHSLISTSEGLIAHGTGLVNVNVTFRLIVWRPFKGEILQGTIIQSDREGGVWLGMDFFEDLQVPPSVLFEPSAFNVEDGKDESEGVWVWRSENADAENGKGYDEYFFDRNEKCLARVEMEVWNDVPPQMTKPAGAVDGEAAVEERKQPYAVQASMMHSGLGPKLWWLGEEELAGEVQEAEEMGEGNAGVGADGVV